MVQDRSTSNLVTLQLVTPKPIPAVRVDVAVRIDLPAAIVQPLYTPQPTAPHMLCLLGIARGRFYRPNIKALQSRAKGSLRQARARSR